jgi:hypothetical protein
MLLSVRTMELSSSEHIADCHAQNNTIIFVYIHLVTKILRILSSYFVGMSTVLRTLLTTARYVPALEPYI